MTQTNPRTSPHLRPHTADLNRLLAGEHHDPIRFWVRTNTRIRP